MHKLSLKFKDVKLDWCEGGGNYPAVAVPLVALGTQNGTIDVIDVYANAIAASFSVHSTTVRGLRWLGNSRLVSFSYTKVHYMGVQKFSILLLHHICLKSSTNMIPGFFLTRSFLFKVKYPFKSTCSLTWFHNLWNQVSEKSGGYINKLVVTCVRSGLNKPFRLIQKPERAPIRALRTSSSGRLILNLCSFITFSILCF